MSRRRRVKIFKIKLKKWLEKELNIWMIMFVFFILIFVTFLIIYNDKDFKKMEAEGVFGPPTSEEKSIFL